MQTNISTPHFRINKVIRADGEVYCLEYWRWYSGWTTVYKREPSYGGTVSTLLTFHNIQQCRVFVTEKYGNLAVIEDKVL